MNIAKELESIGLNEKQAKIFLAALELGPATISDISRRSKIKRSTVYNLIDPLLQQNLMSKIPQKKRVLYKAKPPRRILSILEEKRRNFEKLLPQLESLHNAKGSRPRVKFHEGKEGILEAYREMFTTSKKIYSVGSIDEILSVLKHEEVDTIFGLLRKNGGKLLDLLKPSEVAEDYSKQEYRKGLSTIKTLPPDFEIQIDIITRGNKTAFFSFKSLMAVIIEDEDIAKSQQQLLKYIWKSIK